MKKLIASRCLDILKPGIAQQWDMKKNHLTPKDVSCFSSKKVWWRCDKNHSWEAVISNRTLSGHGCPYCSGRKTTKDKSIIVTHPHLIDEWDYGKNKILPHEISYASSKRVWWVCKHGHHWETIMSSRGSLGTNCPYCCNQKISPKNSLVKTHPVLLKEWDFKRNTIPPHTVSHGTAKKIWWLCKKGHSWLTSVLDRARGRGCPYCSNKKVIPENSIATTHLNLSKEWDCTKNKIKIDSISYGSHKKVWWKCKQGHCWEASVYNRVQGKGCPYCSGRMITPEKSILTTHPFLASEWDHNKNTKLILSKTAAFNRNKVWWICSKGHSWAARVVHRAIRLTGCPYCAYRKVSPDNCFLVTHPALVKEWNFDKNKLLPSEITYKSEKPIWWTCHKGHTWLATCRNRSGVHGSAGSGCPFCSGRNASLEHNLAVDYPFLAPEWHPTKNGDIKPTDVCGGSEKRFWWVCRKGHEWRSSVSNRTHGRGCSICSHKKVVLCDGVICDSQAEAYVYLKFKENGIRFIHNRPYGGSLGRSRCDFFLPDFNKYIEVTAYHEKWTHWKQYFAKIKRKRKFSLKHGFDFDFLMIVMKPQDFCFVRQHLAP